jgi:hypothetical protein
VGPIGDDRCFKDFAVPGNPSVFAVLPRTAGESPVFLFEIGPPLRFFGAISSLKLVKDDYRHFRVSGAELGADEEQPTAGAVVFARHKTALRVGLVKVVVWNNKGNGVATFQKDFEVAKGTPIPVVIQKAQANGLKGPYSVMQDGKLVREEEAAVAKGDIRLDCLKAPLFWGCTDFERQTNAGRKVSIEVRGGDGKTMGYLAFGRKYEVGEMQALREKGSIFELSDEVESEPLLETPTASKSGSPTFAPMVQAVQTAYSRRKLNQDARLVLNVRPLNK